MPEIAKPTAPLTNWLAFVKAKLVPKEITCQGYPPIHPRDNGCHTRLPKSVTAMLPHTTEHSGGFKIVLRQSERDWEGWAELAKSGLELTDFRCDICDTILPLNSNRILNCMKPHKGKSRKVLPGGAFWFTISTVKPVSDTEDDDL